MRQLISAGLILTLLPVLQGCVPVLVGGTAAVMAPTVAEERTIGQVVSDTEIRAKINSKWMDCDPKMQEMVELQVREGRVLLTGLFDTPQRQIDAVRLAWEVNGVKEVIDETRIGQDTLGNYAKDTWITTRLKTELLFDEYVNSVNYTIKTVDGTVYLMGIAQSQNELDSVVRRARQIGGVKGVINHARVKNSSVTATSYNESSPSIIEPTNTSEIVGGSGTIQEQPLPGSISASEMSFPNPQAY